MLKVRHLLCVAFFFGLPLFSNDIPSESLEIGLERLSPVAPQENAAFTGLLINWYPTRYFYIGTSQTTLYVRGETEYRPDFHIGVILPLIDHLSLEGTLGVDFLTALIVTVAILDKDDSFNYKFSSAFYAPYFTFTAALRFDFNGFALKAMAQSQFGGYLQSDTRAFNASLWLGLGATYRFAF